jgi:eukaryotic-like serine/threonine-protein kinase
MIGQRLLHYEITEKLGEGGMGVVYKARDTRLGRSVALKVLPPDKVADGDRRRRFIQEARAASALNHPNIVVVHDIGSENGCDFIAMESVQGKTLDQLIPRSGMQLAELLRIAIQIVGALARAHSAGIVHRDLKPSNVMVDEQGHVKVLDFGLSKLTERAVLEDGSSATVDLKTAEGTIVGTVPYMSPEQAEGKPVDARSDIFSLGSLLYEMATGRRAFQGDTPVVSLSAILQLGLWRCRAGGGEETQIATGLTFLNHALTDKGVYFVSRPDVESAATLRFLPYAATTSRPVLVIANPVGNGMTVSPDGKSLLFVRLDQSGSDLMLVEGFR